MHKVVRTNYAVQSHGHRAVVDFSSVNSVKLGQVDLQYLTNLLRIKFSLDSLCP